MELEKWTLGKAIYEICSSASCGGKGGTKQAAEGEKLTYCLVEEKGPDHDKRFVVEVRLNSNVIGKGEGRSKKTAEQIAAKEALQLMGK